MRLGHIIGRVTLSKQDPAYKGGRFLFVQPFGPEEGALLLAGGAERSSDGSLRLPHQAIVEFVAVVVRPLGGGSPLLTPHEALREAEELLAQLDVLYPDEALLRLAVRGAAAYQLSWFDAHLWAYAERFGLDSLISEDFQHDRLYGSVRVINPFRD